MSALTLHTIDDNLAAALRRHADELGTSLNKAAKALLAGALGLTTADRRRRPGFLKFAGSISRKDAKSMMAFVNDAEFSKVSAEDWK